MKPLRLVFMGTPDIACPSLEALAQAGHQIVAVVTQPDRRAGRGKKITRCPVARAASQMDLGLIQPQRIGEIAHTLRELNADAAVVLAYGQLLPTSVLDSFPLGCVNAHFSLLPLLRGAAPINWAIIKGHAQTGVSTMFMDPGLDTGDIIQQQASDIGPQETAGALADRLAVMGAELLIKTMDLVSEGQAPRTPQDHAAHTYAPRFKKSDGALDFTKPAVELDRLVRGCDPWPGAFLKGPKGPIKLFAPTALTTKSSAQPGQIIAPPLNGNPGLLWLACGQGSLGLAQIQAPGKKRLAAPEFIRGTRLQPGDYLEKK